MPTLEMPYDYNRLKCVDGDVDILSCQKDGGNSLFQSFAPLVSNKIPNSYFSNDSIRKRMWITLYRQTHPSFSIAGGAFITSTIRITPPKDFGERTFVPLSLVGVQNSNKYIDITGFEIVPVGDGTYDYKIQMRNRSSSAQSMRNGDIALAVLCVLDNESIELDQSVTRSISDEITEES